MRLYAHGDITEIMFQTSLNTKKVKIEVLAYSPIYSPIRNVEE